jgi:hypothetical protein
VRRGRRAEERRSNHWKVGVHRQQHVHADSTRRERSAQTATSIRRHDGRHLPARLSHPRSLHADHRERTGNDEGHVPAQGVSDFMLVITTHYMG